MYDIGPDDYDAPQDDYDAPQDDYDAPQDDYDAPQDDYDAPQDDQDMTPDAFGIALGLGEEIAMENQARKMSQKESDAVRSNPVSDGRNLTPVSNFNKDSKLVDLTNFNNWIVDFTKRLRSPFIEKWKAVAVGTKAPDAPLLSHSERHAYEMAQEKAAIDDEMDKESRNIVVDIQKLKRKRSELNMIKVGKEILKRRK